MFFTRRFSSFLKVLLCMVYGFLWLLSPVFFTQSEAANSIFTVKGVTVDVTAEDAMKARTQAFEKAQVKAYQKLMTRIMPDEEAAAMQTPVTPVISNLIQDYEVTREKLSSVRYIGTYTFRFKEDAVKRFVMGRGASYTDVGSRPVLVLPFWQTDRAGSLIWSPNNIWLSAWNRARELDGLVPVVVPVGDIQDIQDIADGEALHYEERNLRSMLRRYDAREAVVLIAEPDAELAQVQTDIDSAAGKLYVQIYRTDTGSPELVQELAINAKGGETRMAFFDRAVKQVHKALQTDWKNKTVVTSTQGMNTLAVRVHIDDLKQWAQTQAALRQVQGIEQVQLKSLTPKYARVDLLYKGDLERLKLALDQAEMTLSAPKAEQEPQKRESYLDRYSIDSFLSGDYDGDTGADPVYDLYLGRYAAPQGREPQSDSQRRSRSGFSYESRPQNAQEARYPGRYVPPQAEDKERFEANF